MKECGRSINNSDREGIVNIKACTDAVYQHHAVLLHLNLGDIVA